MGFSQTSKSCDRFWNMNHMPQITRVFESGLRLKSLLFRINTSSSSNFYKYLFQIPEICTQFTGFIFILTFSASLFFPTSNISHTTCLKRSQILWIYLRKFTQNCSYEQIAMKTKEIGNRKEKEFLKSFSELVINFYWFFCLIVNV